MVMLNEGTDKQYPMDGYLKDNLDTARKVIKKDWDMVFAIDGPEGSGKSTLAIQCAYYCDPTLDLNRIVFTPDEFKAAILSAKPYASVVYDEAYTGLSSRAAMSKINRVLVAMLAEIRQKNLFVWIVMPTFFDLDRYAALWRTRGLIHVYTGDDFRRGLFAFYNADKKKDLYINGKKFYSYYTPKPNFTGTFGPFLPIDKTGYDEKKRLALEGRSEKVISEETAREATRLMFTRLVELGENMTHEERAHLLQIPISTYYDWLKKYERDGVIP